MHIEKCGADGAGTKEQTFPQQLKPSPIKKVAIAPNPTAILKPIPAGEKQKDYTAERIFPLFILKIMARGCLCK